MLEETIPRDLCKQEISFCNQKNFSNCFQRRLNFYNLLINSLEKKKYSFSLADKIIFEFRITKVTILLFEMRRQSLSFLFFHKVTVA